MDVIRRLLKVPEVVLYIVKDHVNTRKMLNRSSKDWVETRRVRDYKN